jgi:large subunit ribosomal protein L25
MKLTSITRSAQKKSEAQKLRRSGYIPAVLYSQGKIGDNIAVKSDEFKALLRNLPQGRLPTTIVTLVDADGRERRAIVKDIQYNIVSYDIITLDFEELHDKRPVNIKVPIECVGVADCVGVKLGGVLRSVIRHVRVRCLPEAIPDVFFLDVTDLAMRQSRRLAEIKWPENVRPLADLNEVAVVIAKR